MTAALEAEADLGLGLGLEVELGAGSEASPSRASASASSSSSSLVGAVFFLGVAAALAFPEERKDDRGTRLGIREMQGSDLEFKAL